LVELSFSYERKLAKILFDIYYPKVQESGYYHYTKISAFRHIIKGELKLKSLIHNDNYDEFKTFYTDHDLLGYFNTRDYEGTLMKDALMKEIFTFCLASKIGLDDKKENALWQSFGDNKHGIRIEFEITTSHPDFRKIFYKNNITNKADLVINRLRTIIREKYNRDIFIPGVSKIGAFYLPGDYSIENEVRFVVKKHTDEYEFYYNDFNGNLILPFDNKYARFVIKKIKIGEHATLEEREEILKLLLDNNYTEDVLE
jgi:hypothetical protein